MKKALSFILCAVMLVMCVVPCFAAENAKAPQGQKECNYPVILVRGMDFTGLTADMGTENERGAVKSVTAGSIFKTVFKVLSTSLFTLSLDRGVEQIVDFVQDIMGSLACDENGNSKYNVTTVTYDGAVALHPELYDVEEAACEYGMAKTLADVYGAENIYFYVYDWRLDPYDNADDLNAVIDRALNEHPGKEKVDIVCCSMGGMQTSVYMGKYGYSRINKVMFMSAAFLGAYVTTDLFQGKVQITADNLANYCAYASRDNEKLGKLVSFASKIGIFKLAQSLAKKFTDRYSEMAYSEFLLDTFGTMPGFWALVLPEAYDDCMEYMFPDDAARAKYAGVIEKAQRLHELSLEREDMLKNAAEDGVSITVTANYDIPLIPVYERAGVNGDGILETEPMSGFAKVAAYGEKLEGVTAGRYVSADLAVDASGCLFPDYTWIIKGAPHVSGSVNTDYADFLVWLVGFEGQPTIDSSVLYPQFMLSGTDETLSPLTR